MPFLKGDFWFLLSLGTCVFSVFGHLRILSELFNQSLQCANTEPTQSLPFVSSFCQQETRNQKLGYICLCHREITVSCFTTLLVRPQVSQMTETSTG